MTKEQLQGKYATGDWVAYCKQAGSKGKYLLIPKCQFDSISSTENPYVLIHIKHANFAKEVAANPDKVTEYKTPNGWYPDSFFSNYHNNGDGVSWRFRPDVVMTAEDLDDVKNTHAQNIKAVMDSDPILGDFDPNATLSSNNDVDSRTNDALDAKSVDGCSTCGNFIDENYNNVNCNGCSKNPFYMNCYTVAKKKWYEDEANFPALIMVDNNLTLVTEYDSGEFLDEFDGLILRVTQNNWRLATKQERDSLYCKD